MKNRVEFQLQFGDDEAIVDELARFFSPVATLQIRKEEEKAVKAWETAIVIAMTILCEWATTRYVLDPLAGRTEEWIKSIISAWEKSESKRSFNIVVKFEHGADTFEVQISDTSDHEVLKQAWRYIGKAHQVVQSARKQGVTLAKIRILPDGTQGLLVIGYEDSRPKYIIDLEGGSIHQMQSSSSRDEPHGLEVQLWLVEQLSRRLAHLRLLVEKGYNVSEDEILRLEREIENEKAKLKLH